VAQRAAEDFRDARGAEAASNFTRYFVARRDPVRRTAYLLCGDWYWADDLTQVAFVRLAAAWDRVRDPGAMDAFVRTCLLRAYLSETRRLWRRREHTSDQAPEHGVDDIGPVAGRLDLMEALRGVPPRQRATLICRFYQGLDVEETAAALGCSAGTVKSQTARGLATLRRLLGEKELAS
jgi:RNA polymerase sigma-70 factor (sigma-E family)